MEHLAQYLQSFHYKHEINTERGELITSPVFFCLLFLGCFVSITGEISAQAGHSFYKNTLGLWAFINTFWLLQVTN